MTNRQIATTAEIGGQLRFVVLGPLRGWSGDEELELGWPKQRTILAVLVMAAGRAVTRADLVDAVWGDDPPPSSASLVHTYLGRLRRILNPAGPGGRPAGDPMGRSLSRTDRRMLVGGQSGYTLRLAPNAVDLTEFHARLDGARQRMSAGDLVAAVDGFDSALALWRGTALAGIAGGWAERQRVRLGELRLAAVTDRADAALRLGRHTELVPELAGLVAEYPLRERLRALLMTAMYRSGRQAEALAVYAEARRLLVDELGIEPGCELRRVHRAILTAAATDLTADRAADSDHLDLAGAGRVVPRQLPPAIRHFAGRVYEVDTLSSLADRAASDGTMMIAVIDGTAGIGKTALALYWAHRVAARFPDGQLYVNLRGFDPDGPAMEPVEAVRGFLDALGVSAQRIPVGLHAQSSLYRSLLADRRMLVVLDNARDVDQVRPLLPGGPTSLVVVTSRNRLAGLVALVGAYPLTLDLLSEGEAHDVLVNHLGPARVAAEPGAARDIVTRSARLPLALSIVASRAAAHPLFPLAALAGELTGTRIGLDAFDAGHPAGNLRALFSWSYRRLSVGPDRLFRLLGVHCGPDITVPGAASLCAISAVVARRSLTELADAHLVTEHRPGRYSCHDLLRAYAVELATRQDPAAERQAALRRDLDHYLHTGYTAAVLLNPSDPIVVGAPEPGVTPERPATINEALAWFIAEHDGLLAAVRVSADAGLDLRTWELVWTLSNYLERRGHWHDRVTVQRAALDAAGRLADQRREAHAHRGLAAAHLRLNQCDDAHTQLCQALDLYATLGDSAGQAHVQHSLAQVFERRGQYRQALRCALLALDLYDMVGDRAGQAKALNGIGWCHALLGEHREALIYCEQSLAQPEQLGYGHGQAAALDSLGYTHHQLGDFPRALARFRRAVGLYHDLGDRYNEAATLVNLGDTQLALADRDGARSTWQQALAILDRLDHPDADQVVARLRRLDDGWDLAASESCC
jgi:DNA-binding SARP family transcriptional activator/tetratricopeptide (TPR) repeat protein